MPKAKNSMIKNRKKYDSSKKDEDNDEERHESGSIDESSETGEDTGNVKSMNWFQKLIQCFSSNK